MKIVSDKKVYVQKNDLVLLNQSDVPIPPSIFMKVFGSGMVIIDDRNRNEFIEFLEPEEIEFFKSLDWMIDYNEVKNLSEDIFCELGQNIIDERSEITKNFNSMSDEEKQKCFHLVSRCELLDFKLNSLRDILWFKQDYISMDLPYDVEYPNTFQKQQNSESKTMKEKRLFKSVFNRMKQD